MVEKKKHFAWVQHCYHAVVKRCPAGTLDIAPDRPVIVIEHGSNDGYGIAISRSESLRGPWQFFCNVQNEKAGSSFWQSLTKEDYRRLHRELTTYCLRPDIEHVPYEGEGITTDHFNGLFYASRKYSKVTAGKRICGDYIRERHTEAQYIAAARSFMEPLIKLGYVIEEEDKFKLTEEGSEEMRRQTRMADGK